MKLTTFMITICCLHLSAAVFSQQITLAEKNRPLKEVLLKIRKQSGFQLLYDAQLIEKASPVTVNLNSVPIGTALEQIFSQQPFTYSVFDKTILVRERDKTQVVEAVKTVNVIIEGRVVEAGQKGLPLVSVRLKGGGKATATNAEGVFKISVPQENAILIFSCIGFATKELLAKAGMLVVLESESKALNDLVVVGYGSSRKKDLTGSVSTVDIKSVQDVPFLSVDNALAGKVAGVQVTKADGTPGGAVRIRIRGSSSLLGGNDPLYVIDGVPIQVQSNFINTGFDVSSPVGNDINNLGGVNAGLSASFVNGLNNLGGLNVNDIESISILKDASSTAIYGSKAANGVVIITTKRGKKDMKPQVTAGYYTTVTTPITPKLLNGSQYKMLLTEAARNDFNERTAKNNPIPEQINAILNHPDAFFGNANTDWIKEVTRNTISHNADLSVQGGGSSSKYFSSISYNNSPGVIKSSGYERISGKLNLENEIGKNFRFITNLILGYTNQQIGDGAYGQALRARPDFAPYDADGLLTNFAGVGESYQGFQNPVALLKAINDAKTFSLIGSLSAVYDLTKDLQFKSTVSLNQNIYNQRNYVPSYLSIGSFYGNVDNSGGIGSNSNSRFTNWFLENTVTYTKNIKDIHEITVLAGTAYETKKFSFFSATATGYPDDNVLNNLSSAITPLFTKGDDPSRPQSYLLSFYVRANYGLMDKYLFTFTGRSDGSSKFGPNNKFGYFPSGAIAWRVSKENFLKNVKWIDDIKFRGSYGLTGSQNIGDQMYRTLYTPFSYGGSSALVPTQLGNEAVKWESTTEADAGLDLSLFDNRLQATVDYYNKKTSGALISLPVGPSTSYSSLLRNVAGLKNTGFEVSLQGDIIRTKDFRWNASINVTWNRTLVTKLDASADLSQIGSMTGLELGNTLLVEGQPLGLITGHKVTGIIRTQEQLEAYKKVLGDYGETFLPYLNIGDAMYELSYEVFDGVTYARPKEKAIIAHAAPNYFGGFTQGFSYKGLDLQLYFAFSQGGKLLWGDHVSSTQFSGTANANAVMLNRLNEANPNSDRPRLLLGDGQATASNLDVFSSSYLKLRTVSMNYRFVPAEWMKRNGLLNLSVFASASNLFTITKYPGNDPETSNDTYSVTGGYFDASNYPTVRTFSLGLKVGF